MKKLILEFSLSIVLVFIPTFIVYSILNDFPSFWDAQTLWSIILAIGWIVVAAGYYHQGWLVHKGKSAAHVSIVLPSAVFLVQCVLFIKGIYYSDWSLIWGAVVVNSGVIFSVYQIITNGGGIKIFSKKIKLK